MKWILIVLIAAGIAFVVIRLRLRHRYVRELRALGWTFSKHVPLDITFGLNNPPFGLGTNRKVSDQIVGTSPGGVSFQAFRYRSSEGKSDGLTVTMPLPRSLPEFYMFPPDKDLPVQGIQLAAEPLVVVSSDEDFGRTVCIVTGGAVAELGTYFPVDLSIDHDQLVAHGAPHKVSGLRNFIAALDAVHSAILGTDLSRFDGEAPPEHLSFYRRSHWIYEPRNDDFLNYVAATQTGDHHEAVDVIHSDNYGLPFIALTHNWQTHHTRSDSKGNSYTVTEHHTEYLMEFRVPFPFRPLSINTGRGKPIRFESEAFNKAFKVRADVPRFASDVLHPRQLEYLLRTQPYPFAIEADNRIVVSVPSSGADVVDFMTSFMNGFFGRIPDFTWKELGAWPRPIPAVTDYSS